MQQRNVLETRIERARQYKSNQTHYQRHAGHHAHCSRQYMSFCAVLRADKMLCQGLIQYYSENLHYILRQ